MEYLHLNWFALSMIFVGASSISKLLQKVALRGNDVHPTAYSIFYQLFAGIAAIPLAVLGPRNFNVGAKVWAVVTISCIIYAGISLLYFFALKSVDVSQVEIISTTKAVWFLILGIIVFNEAITVNKLIGIFLIMFGLAFVYWRNGGFKEFGLPQLYMVGYAFFISIAASLDKYVLNFLSAGTYQVIAFILPALITAAFIPSAIPSIRPLMKFNKTTLLIFTVVVLQTIATFSWFSAFKSGGEISKVGPVVQSSTVLTVVLGIILLGERRDTWRKIMGAFIVVAGVILIKIM